MDESRNSLDAMDNRSQIVYDPNKDVLPKTTPTQDKDILNRVSAIRNNLLNLDTSNSNVLPYYNLLSEALQRTDRARSRVTLN